MPIGASLKDQVGAIPARLPRSSERAGSIPDRGETHKAVLQHGIGEA